MDFLPKDIENIVDYYLECMKNYEEALESISTIDYFEQQDTYVNMFQHAINKINSDLTDKYNFQLTDDEIYKQLRVNSHFIDKLQLITNPMNKNIGFLPLQCIILFKDVLCWYSFNGTIYVRNNRRIHELPHEFLSECKDYIDWRDVGCGLYGNPKIEDLPRDFVREFKDYILWDFVGGLNMNNYANNYTNINNLPEDFLNEFKDYIKIIETFDDGKMDLFMPYEDFVDC